MKCPADQNQLVEKQGEGFVYHQCPECDGLWTRFRSLRTVVQKYNPDAEIALPHPERLTPLIHRTGFDTNNVTKCPLDGTDYFEHRFGSVLLDICQNCDGIWFDAGELEKVKQELKDQSSPDNPVEVFLWDADRFFEYIAGVFSLAPEGRSPEDKESE